MRALLRLRTAVVGRIPSQGCSKAFGGLLPCQNRHLVRENVRSCTTKAEKHKADLVLDVRCEPLSHPEGCDKNDYRSYFKRSKVYMLARPLEDRLGNITETVQGLRPDAVVLLDRSPIDVWLLDFSPPFAKFALSEEAVVAYRAAKALRHCTVVCDGTRVRYVLQAMSIPFRKLPKWNANVAKRMHELDANKAAGVSELERNKRSAAYSKLFNEVYPDSRVIRLKWTMYMASVLQRTLNERSSQKYERLRASKKGTLEPVRIVALVDFTHLEGIKESWQRPIEKERIDEMLTSRKSSLGGRIVAAVALLYIVSTLANLEELVWRLVITKLKSGQEI